MTTLSAKPTFDDTLGAAFLGGIAASMSIVAQVIPGAVSDTLVRCVYASRIWRYALSSSFKQWMVYSALTSALVVDVCIAIFLCYSIYQKRTGFRNTNAMLKKVILLAINTGLLMTFGSISVFIAYAARPHSLIYIEVYMPTNKIYINALLASLNAREGVCGNDDIITDSAMPVFDNEDSMDLSDVSLGNKSTDYENLKSSGIPQANFPSSTVYANHVMPTKIDVKAENEDR
ncbi:hypothetical protein BDQ12DRAFT_726693 [Crucibulum laeve]|uniref:DUF6534 domain-containing protein n=1 Tax=Crucibulum laeve TaxID=68775 RepID=A0A5C3LQQ6_9AGAR|nr:hypothetical protein BDQ12DRAFT_726693 [Crucibulum laeve]